MNTSSPNLVAFQSYSTTNETIEIYNKPQEGHNQLPPKEWSSEEHQQGVRGHFKEDNQL